MMKVLLKSSLLLALVTSLIFVSCEQESLETAADLVSVDNYVEASVVSLQDSAQCGRHGCFELVFPLSIEFPDGTIEEVADYDELKSVIRSWKESNPEVDVRPSFVYPIEVINSEGEIITIEDAEALRELRKECGRGFRDRIKKWRKFGKPCFDIVMPVTIEFPDGTTAEVNDREELKQAVRTWKEANPGVDGRPVLTFPITVEFEDGSTQTIETIEDLRTLKETCQEASDDEND
ncbi:MAG: hypothetical protein AAFR66_21660 [Bacteroidota bacterium]